MAPLLHLSFRKVLFFFVFLFVFTSTFLCVCSEIHGQAQSTSSNNRTLGRRNILELEEDAESIKKKSNTMFFSSKNHTKSIKPITGTSIKNQTVPLKVTSSLSKINQTKLIKLTTSDLAKNQSKLDKLGSDSGENKTKLTKPTTNSAKETTPKIKTLSKKLNSPSKVSNSTKSSSLLANNSLDLVKLGTPKNKTSKATTTKDSTTQSDQKLTEAKTKTPEKKSKTEKSQTSTKSSWIAQDEEEDLVSEFRDLPSKFQETLLPDLERISSTSKIYLTKANKHITKGFKPIVGNKYAPTIASIISFAFIIIPFILVSLIFNRIKAYFSLQKLLIFVQIYLSIYFSILCLSSLVTGLEPLRFFYATAQSTYICVQVLQTLGYVLYLLLLLMYLVLVFSTDTGLASKMLALGQTFVGFAVGLHYYMTVFHRTVLSQPPKTSWKVHAFYAAVFLVICWLGRAERRKKAYLEDGGEEGKKS